jgi:hypothetical protein
MTAPGQPGIVKGQMRFYWRVAAQDNTDAAPGRLKPSRGVLRLTIEAGAG